MNEINIKCSLESPQDKDTDITISVANTENEDLLYKFLIGKDGTWRNLRDFDNESSVVWTPNEEGKYIIMIQGKKENSDKSFDYISKLEYAVGEIKERLIKNLYIDKEDINLGDKITINVEGNKIPLMYRYWIREDDKWELIKDYSPDNVLSWTVLTSGIQQILVECRNLDSSNNCDDFETISFKVKDIRRLEITDFRCLTKNILKGREILFQVNASYEDNRMILYKFIRVDSNGKANCIQDYSTKRTVSYMEDNSGEYKLLCLAKDMYSPREFDDRAVIFYKVKEYDKIRIQAFTTDLSSPQICGTSIELKAIVKGGESVLYRFKIEGEHCDDSGNIKKNKYIWKPEKSGSYKIYVLVKDESFDGEYEVKDCLEFTVDEISREDVKIEEIIYYRRDTYLKNEVINVEVEAVGGIELKYSFIVKKKGKEVEKVSYGDCNWVNFTPEECGNYDLEIKVKDKYSKRDYDTHTIVPFEVRDYIPANIDYILTESKELYMVGDKVDFEIVSQNTNSTVVKYKLKINGHNVEETDFIEQKIYQVIPKCRGLYVLEILARNKRSSEEYDCKKEVRVFVNDCFPVTSTKLKSDKLNFICNECANFSVTSEGGKDVLYEFYLMERGEWSLVQRYSKKGYYSFIPFTTGIYRILVLSKSMYKKMSYEDYDTFEFYVDEEQI